jgi:hypothetical protein
MIRRLLVAWLVAIMFLSVHNASAQVTELKPNIQVLPAGGLAIVMDSSGRTQLIFSATTWNSGDGPLVLIAGSTDSVSLKQNVYQRISLSDGSDYDRLAGTFEWHPTHNHFHFDDYALYTLQPSNAPGASERTSQKTSFCVMDTTKVNTRLPGASKRPVYTICGNTQQGMSVGWGDTYGNHLPGQSIDLTGLPDGDYKLLIQADPKKRLLEINDSDNTSCVLLRISVTNLALNVLNSASCVTPGGGTEVVVSGIDPNTALSGSIVPVTITGSGFVSGIGVSFENGSGPRPVVSNINVVDSNTINAILTLKNGGAKTDPVWDVRIGSGVLLNGFAVQ